MELKLKPRKVQKSADAFYICLPKDYARSFNIEKGTLVNMKISEAGELVIKKNE